MSYLLLFYYKSKTVLTNAWLLNMLTHAHHNKKFEHICLFGYKSIIIYNFATGIMVLWELHVAWRRRRQVKLPIIFRRRIVIPFPSLNMVINKYVLWLYTNRFVAKYILQHTTQCIAKEGAVHTEQISYYRQAVDAYKVSKQRRIPETLEKMYIHT